MKYLVTDVETGGFEGTSLLTAYFGAVNEKFDIVKELYLYLKPNDGIYKVMAGKNGLGINKINLNEHETKAISYKDGGQILWDFLKDISEGGAKMPQPLGHNVYFDIQRITEDLVTPNTWKNFVSYRLLDTGTIGSYLKDKGKIPKDISGSLGSYCKYFGIDTEGAHEAKKDCMMVIELYRKMLAIE